jgi:hypothetical protein
MQSVENKLFIVSVENKPFMVSVIMLLAFKRSVVAPNHPTPMGVTFSDIPSNDAFQSDFLNHYAYCKSCIAVRFS